MRTDLPLLTLSEIHGPGIAFSARSSWNGANLLRRADEAVRDSSLGPFLTIAGHAPIISSRGTIGPEIRDMYNAAGLPGPTAVSTYCDASEYLLRIRELIEAGNRIALRYLHPRNEIPEAAYWIPPSLVARLNDKAEIGTMVPLRHRPSRRVIPLEEAASIHVPPGGTVVVKGSTSIPTGGGGAVVIIRDARQLAELPTRLAGAERLVVEEFYAFERTMCVTWAATFDGHLHYVGSADQVVNPEGVYLGSWAGAGFEPPAGALEAGRAIMEAAIGAGYVGLAGLDMGVHRDGTVLVFDLNFRPCASTPALLWLPSFAARAGGGLTLRIGTLSSVLPFARMCQVAAVAAERGELLPLGAFNPDRAGWPGRQPVVRGAVLGRNRAETEARCEALAAEGLRME